MPTLTDEDRLGTTIGDGKYTLESVLGRGGMGTVFEAIHRWTGRRVAVKLLLDEMALDIDASHRFLQEARAVTAIEHPNVVEVLDMGRHDESSVYMVFELLRGESLADRLEAQGPLDAMQTAMILLPVADALAAAHRLGIVHRDVKPDNIFLEDDGMGYVRPKLLDFGIVGFSERKSRATHPEIIMGTPGYLSPEHAQGFQAVPASDVWSLGVVLFECLTGYCPFESDSLEGAMLAIASRPVPSLRAYPNVPESIAHLVERTLVRDPAARFPDGAAFRDALAAASQVEVLPSHSRSVPPKIVRDSWELSLSSAHRVEIRHSRLTPTSMPRPVYHPTPVPERPEAPSSQRLPQGVPVPVDTGEITRRIDSDPGTDDDLGAIEVSALRASLVPERGRWRRPAMLALPVLLLLLVPTVAMTHQPTQPADMRGSVGVVGAEAEATPEAARSATGAPVGTAWEAVPYTSALPSDVGASAESSPADAREDCSLDASPAPTIFAVTRRAAGTKSRARARERSGGSRTAEPLDTGAERVDAGTAPIDSGTPPVDPVTGLVDAVTALVGADPEPVDADPEPVDVTMPPDGE